MKRLRRLALPTQVLLALLLALALLGASCASAPTYRAEFPSAPVAQPAGQVLVVLTAAGEQPLADGSKRPTGYFLNELYEPYRALAGAGYEVVVATPGGRPAPIDPESLDVKYWPSAEALAEARASLARLPQLTAPLTLAQARASAEQYQGLLVPGGQGVMVDLLDDRDLHALMTAYARSHRPIGLICHAPAILARLAAPRRIAPRARLTSVSGFEEWYIETFVMGKKAKVRGIGDLLDDAGYRHESAFPGRSKAVRDCNLVTSQNPFSGEDFNEQYLSALNDYRQGARCTAYSEP
jgi:putative intracellular protease/amidase